MVQLLRIECQPLGAAHAALIHQKGWSGCAESGQPAVGAAEADPILGGKLPEVAAVHQVLGHQPEAALLR